MNDMKHDQYWQTAYLKKGSRNIIFLLKKFVSTALVKDTFYVNFCSVLTQY